MMMMRKPFLGIVSVIWELLSITANATSNVANRTMCTINSNFGKFGQLLSARNPRTRESKSERGRERDRMRSWQGSCSRPSRQEFDICIIIISKLSEGWFPPFLPLSCFLAYRIRLLPFAFNRFPYLCVCLCMCVCVRLHLAATDKFAYQCNGYYLFSLFSFIPNESKISCKAATSS